MKIRITCRTHNDSPQVPAGDNLHWIPLKDGVYELDLGDLYCTGGEGDHDIVVDIVDTLGANRIWLDSDGTWVAAIPQTSKSYAALLKETNEQEDADAEDRELTWPDGQQKNFS
jgi:hypothetical protein